MHSFHTLCTGFPQHQNGTKCSIFSTFLEKTRREAVENSTVELHRRLTLWFLRACCRLLGRRGGFVARLRLGFFRRLWFGIAVQLVRPCERINADWIGGQQQASRLDEDRDWGDARTIGSESAVGDAFAVAR